ncbi:hypothetical protein TWF281_006147 [Arthrobotrys megalospora]
MNPDTKGSTKGGGRSAPADSLDPTSPAIRTVPTTSTLTNETNFTAKAKIDQKDSNADSQTRRQSHSPSLKLSVQTKSTSNSLLPSSNEKKSPKGDVEIKEEKGEEDYPMGQDEDRQGGCVNTDILERMSLNDDNPQSLGLPRNEEEPNCQPLFPFPTEVSQNILGRLSPSELQHFALSSRPSYMTFLSALARNIALPLAGHLNGVKKISGITISDYVRTATVDISDPVFYTTNYPGDYNIGKTLHKFQNLKHLIIQKSSAYASDAVLGSVLLFLVEQNTLEELTLNFNLEHQSIGITEFGIKFVECWRTVPSGAFHSKQRKLRTLNLIIGNKDLLDDGLDDDDTGRFWVTILPTVQKLKLDLRDVPCPESSTDRVDRWAEYLHMVSSSSVVDMEVILHNSVKWPYTEIGYQFPNLERLKASFTGVTKNRPSAELSGLKRMSFLRSVNLQWAYDSIVSHDSGFVGMYSKAKERAKEVVQSKLGTEPKDDKLRMQILKQTKTALTLQRLTSIKDVTWRYKLEESGEEASAKFLFQWIGTEPNVTEVQT